jgi:hypothetical protein
MCQPSVVILQDVWHLTEMYRQLDMVLYQWKLKVYQIYANFMIFYFYANKLLTKANDVYVTCVLPALLCFIVPSCLQIAAQIMIPYLYACFQWLMNCFSMFSSATNSLLPENLSLHYSGRKRCHFGQNRRLSDPPGNVKEHKCSEWCIQHFSIWSIRNNK